jgi:hypothetical protein
VSTGDSEKRMRHLKRSHLRFDVECLDMVRKTDDCDVTHYLYVCTKAGGTQNAILNWPDEKKVIFEEEGFDSDYEDTFS